MTKKREKKNKEPPSCYMNFDPHQGQHMHDLCQKSTCQFHVCLLSSFFLSILFIFFKTKIFFVTSDIDPACVFVCDDADDVCDGVSVWTDLWFVSQPLCTFPSWGRRGFRREKGTENVDFWICDAPCERVVTLTVPECLHRASNC